MQLEASSCPKYNPLVQEIQRKLNSIKYRVHGTWPSLNTDGKFGGMTKTGCYSISNIQEYNSCIWYSW